MAETIIHFFHSGQLRGFSGSSAANLSSSELFLVDEKSLPVGRRLEFVTGVWLSCRLELLKGEVGSNVPSYWSPVGSAL